MGWQDDPVVQAASAEPPQAQAAPWQNDPVVAPAQQAQGIGQSFKAGLESSSTGLMYRGKLPDITLDPSHASWYEKLAEGAGQTLGDLPEMAVGAAGGSMIGGRVGGPMGAIAGGGAGAFAVPTAIRTALMNAYQEGRAVTFGDFLNRTTITQTLKSAAAGAVTAGVGTLAARGVGGAIAPVIGETIAPGTAAKIITGGQMAGNIGAMTVAPALLDGRAPDRDDFMNAAVMTVGLHAAGVAADKMMSVYAKTGVPPEQVMADAKSDPDLMKELEQPAMEGGDPIPKAYQPLAAEATAKTVIPDDMVKQSYSPEVAAMLKDPYAEIPAEKLPNYENFNYIDSPEEAKAVSARASEVFAKEIEAARGSQTWEETKQGALDFLANRAQASGEEFSMPTSDDQIVQLASKAMAVQSLQQAASRALADAARDIQENGATDANTKQMYAAIEMQKAWLATDQGNAAEIARALNARKAMAQTRQLAEQAMEGFTKYADDPEEMAKHILGLGTPEKIGRYAQQLKDKPATTTEKLQQYYRFSLLSGLTVYQVKAAGDLMATFEGMANAALKVPIGMLHGEGAERMAELKALMDNIGQGAKDGMQAMKETWKLTGDNQRAVYGEVGKPNLADKITSFPHRLIESETEFFRILNERTEMGRQAAMKAMEGNLKPGTREYDEAYTNFLQNPTPDMIEASEQAGSNATFTNKTTGVGKLLQDVSNNKYGAWGGYLVPFAKVPANLAVWAIKDTPALGFIMKSMRDDWKAGGSARDGVIARQMIGGTVAYLAASAVAGGTLTGGGLSLSPEQRIARRAAGTPDYSIKVGGTWYRYDRFEPLAAIGMLTADMMEMHQQADEAYKPDVFKLTAMVMGHAIVSLPYFEGIHSFIEGLSSPEKGGMAFDRFVGSWVPSFLAQTAATKDDKMRQVDSVMDAVKERIPLWRETLVPKINPLTGEPEQTQRGLGMVATEHVTNDPVLQEAARLQIGTSNPPKAINLSAAGQRDVGRVELTQEQKALFGTASGQMTHAIMERMISTPMWSQLSNMEQQKVFAKAIDAGHKMGSIAALPPEQRVVEAERIAGELQKRLGH